MWKKVLATAVLFSSLGFVLAFGPDSSGQEKKAAKGRLPAYYADIVNDGQRQQIYAVQEKYAAQIAALNEQLAKITKQRDDEIEKVLNAEQKAKLKTAQDEAAAKKEKKADEKKVADDAPAATAAGETKADAKKATATKKQK